MATKVLTLVGGISKGSINKKLFTAMKELAPSAFAVETFQIDTLPFFTQDLENDPPPIVRDFKKLITDCPAALFITPEYNRSFPGVLKNAIDWGSRPYGKNLWKGKSAAVTGGSIGNIGTFGAQHHLRQVLSYLDMHVMNQPECYLNLSKAFDDKGHLKDEDLKKLIVQFWGAFAEWNQQHS